MPGHVFEIIKKELLNGPGTTDELAERTGLSRAHVRGVLVRDYYGDGAAPRAGRVVDCASDERWHLRADPRSADVIKT